MTFKSHKEDIVQPHKEGTINAPVPVERRNQERRKEEQRREMAEEVTSASRGSPESKHRQGRQDMTGIIESTSSGSPGGYSADCSSIDDTDSFSSGSSSRSTSTTSTSNGHSTLSSPTESRKQKDGAQRGEIAAGADNNNNEDRLAPADSTNAEDEATKEQEKRVTFKRHGHDNNIDANNFKVSSRSTEPSGELREITIQLGNAHLPRNHQDGEQSQHSESTCTPPLPFVNKQRPQHEDISVVINPVDPRIDLSSVQVIHAKEHNSRKDESSMETTCNSSNSQSQSKNHKKSQELMNVYSQLMESCKPFFNRYQGKGNLDRSPDGHNRHSNNDADHGLQATATARTCRDGGTKRGGTARSLSQNPPIKKPQDYNSDSTSIASSCSSSSTSANSRENEELFDLIKRGAAALRRPLSPLLAGQDFYPAPPAEMNIDMGQQIRRPRDGRPGNESSSSRGPRVVSDAIGSSSLNTGSGTGSGNGSGTGSGNDTYPNNTPAGTTSTATYFGGDNKANQRNSEPSYNDVKKAHAPLHESSTRNLSGNTSQYFYGDKNKSSDNHTECSTQERLAVKKRKRMDKRREYEEEVPRQLQSSSDDCEERVFSPGQCVSMEDSLSFTNTAR
jgi:hypothetical protein